MGKRKADELWEQAQAEQAAAGTSFLTCPRCQDTFHGSKKTFCKHHGLDKCPLVARREADVPMDDAPAAGSDDHHVADGVLASVPAAAGSMLDSSRSSQRDEEQLQHSPAAQEQVLPEAPPEDDVWHDASEEFDAAGGAADIHAADSGADDMPAAAAAAAADAFQANVRMLADLLQAGYTEAEIRSMWGVSALLWLAHRNSNRLATC
ncbi:hypothetical protein COO60DRAFT_1630422 [Scenedesmus sp. NREL 46B-D3]|nr:hypothetical protein COO60DRAFT_1630422 [Scenedesmus sp. NREL 46B-D3]